MVYSNKAYPNKEFEFPPPPSWLTWTGEWDYRKPDGSKSDTKQGPIRHHENLYKAKNYIGRYANSYNGNKFAVNWAIYEWTGEKYELRFSGREGDRKPDCPLWSKTIRKPVMEGRDATDDEMAEVLASIEKSMSFLGVSP